MLPTGLPLKLQVLEIPNILVMSLGPFRGVGKLLRSFAVTELGDGVRSFPSDAGFSNAAECMFRSFSIERKPWWFAGFDGGADRAALMATLIITANLNDTDSYV
ncbi:hypothetical protein [Ensifer canadensis]|uniref:hypothetical protein n=1 Tax=Ensifer canadensis TaxID=555315 RepID=UPI0035E3E191